MTVSFLLARPWWSYWPEALVCALAVGVVVWIFVARRRMPQAPAAASSAKRGIGAGKFLGMFLSIAGWQMRLENNRNLRKMARSQGRKR